jgi:hypothetical protein
MLIDSMNKDNFKVSVSLHSPSPTRKIVVNT